jgi:hypothetical protein
MLENIVTIAVGVGLGEFASKLGLTVFGYWQYRRRVKTAAKSTDLANELRDMFQRQYIGEDQGSNAAVSD